MILLLFFKKNAAMVSKMVFKDNAGRRVSDVRTYVENWLAVHPRGRIFIGADSKVKGDYVKYAIVICLWDVGRGVSELYAHLTMPRPADSFSRLWNEVTKAVEIAECIKDLARIEIHVDINSNPGYRSYQLYDASMGFIKSYGYDAAGKPFAWAASCGANRHCQ